MAHNLAVFNGKTMYTGRKAAWLAARDMDAMPAPRMYMQSASAPYAVERDRFGDVVDPQSGILDSILAAS